MHQLERYFPTREYAKHNPYDAELLKVAGLVKKCKEDMLAAINPSYVRAGFLLGW